MRIIIAENSISDSELRPIANKNNYYIKENMTIYK